MGVTKAGLHRPGIDASANESSRNGPAEPVNPVVHLHLRSQPPSRQASTLCTRQLADLRCEGTAYAVRWPVAISDACRPSEQTPRLAHGGTNTMGISGTADSTSSSKHHGTDVEIVEGGWSGQ